MSIWVTCYIEAQIDGEWHSIDLYSKHPRNNMILAPIIDGQSYLRSAIEFYDIYSRIEYNDLSSELKAARKNCEYASWMVMPGKWFDEHRFEVPERVGYVPRQMALDYYGGNFRDDWEDCEYSMISISEYRSLTEEERMAYQYIEYTPPFGPRDTMNTIKNAMIERVRQYNAYPFILSEDRRTRVSLENTRLVIEMR